MAEEENLSGLLLLGCLVGVVMFICFALATLNLLAGKEEAEAPSPDPTSLIAQREDMAQQKQKIEENQKALETEVDYIKRELVELAKKIANQGKTEPVDYSEKIQRLSEELAALEHEKQRLLRELQRKKQETNKVNVYKEMGGNIRFKKPLFLECQARMVLVHPEKKVLHLSDLNKKDVIQAYTAGCDGIVILVRPDGFKTFEILLVQAHKTGLKLAYEPVDAEWQLDFSPVTQP